MTGRRFKTWTRDDEALLTRMFEAGATWSDIGLALDRMPNACEVRANTIGLYATRSMPRAWTDAEVIAVHDGWQDGLNDIAIGKQLGRSTKSIMRKRVALGFIRQPGDPRGVDRVATRSASAAASLNARSGWPHACAAERRRGERLLDRAFGGKPYRDTTPINATHYSIPRDAFPGYQSSAAWAVVG
jgi:hypothetical protein